VQLAFAVTKFFFKTKLLVIASSCSSVADQPLAPILPLPPMHTKAEYAVRARAIPFPDVFVAMGAPPAVLRILLSSTSVQVLSRVLTSAKLQRDIHGFDAVTIPCFSRLHGTFSPTLQQYSR
jgi:hypothetical protein